MKKIVLITSGQPSLNPRLVKEADTLADQGYEVTVIYQYWNKWGTVADLELLPKKKWLAIRTGGDPVEKKQQYLWSRIKHRVGLILANRLGLNWGIAEMAIKRNVRGLLNAATAMNADLYIAHNLGALPAAVLASKIHKSKCGFDAEDFHRQEETDDQKDLSFKLANFIEDKYLPHVNYLTVSSPLIKENYLRIYPDVSSTVLHNVFPSYYIQTESLKRRSANLNLFWFSQTIGKNRGIEDAIKAVAMLKKTNITLTLLGNISEDYLAELRDLAQQFNLSKYQLHFIGPVEPHQLFALASQYDLGLALEPAFCLNNDLALSNKIFTYLTAGIPIIASETTAQRKFLAANPTIGFSYPIGNINELAKIIDYYDSDRSMLDQGKINAIALAEKEFNWEIESSKFLKIIAELLQN